MFFIMYLGTKKNYLKATKYYLGIKIFPQSNIMKIYKLHIVTFNNKIARFFNVLFLDFILAKLTMISYHDL